MRVARTAPASHKVLNFLRAHPNASFRRYEITRAVGIGKSGTDLAVQRLANANLVRIEYRRPRFGRRPVLLVRLAGHGGQALLAEA